MIFDDINTSNLSEYTILLVDDDKTIRDIIMRNLRAFGFKSFLQASSGTEAYEKLVNARYEVDLVLCDWEMPRGDGITLLQKIRSNPQCSEVPFIMITAQQSQERLKIAKAAQFNVTSYIVKPFQSEVLRKKVFEALIGTMGKKSIVNE